MAKKKKAKKKKGLKKGLLIALAAIAGAAAVFLIYVSDCYHAESGVYESVEADGSIVFTRQHGDYILMPGDGADTGVIIYPGGKVAQEAYLPLAQKIAHGGVMCAVVNVPFNLAVFDIMAGDAVIEMFADIESWYVGGHSLGGSMAASYAAQTEDDIDGIFLLAAYSTEDLSGSGLDAAAMYGSEDGVMSALSFEKYLRNLPPDAVVEVIEGGNHAGFGSYGEQSGDGTALITSEEQQQLAADIILDMVK